MKTHFSDLLIINSSFKIMNKTKFEFYYLFQTQINYEFYFILF